MTDLGDIPSKPLFKRQASRVYLEEGNHNFVLRINLDASKVLNTLERDIVTKLLHLHIVAKRNQVVLNRGV